MYGLLRFRLLYALTLMLAAAGWVYGSQAEEEDDELPSFATIERLVSTHFSEQEDYKKGDLISKRDAVAILTKIKEQGWEVADQKEILELLLDEGDALVQTLRAKNGRKFMRKVTRYRHIYDRLDLIARVPGGRQLLTDLVKLPDGQRYAKYPPQRGVPDLLDLLPKNRSGRRRSIKNYGKPTGKIYTTEAFLKRLQESHAQALRESRTERAQ